MKTIPRPTSSIPGLASSGLLSLFLVLGGPVACSRDLTVGVVLPLSGEDAPYGQSLSRGMTLAMAELASGEAPPPFTLRFEDSRSEAQRAAALTEALCRESSVIVGGATGEELTAMVSIISGSRALMLSVGAGSLPAEENTRELRFFRLVPAVEVEAGSIARFVTESLQLDSLAVVADDSPYGDGLLDALEDSFPGTLLVWRFPPGAKDLSEIVTELQRAAPPAVFVAAEGYDLVRAIRAVRAAGLGGWKRPILSGSTLASRPLLDEMGEASNGVVFAQTRFDLGAGSEPMQSFVQAYEMRYGELPDSYAARGYDAVRVLAAALEHSRGPSAPELEKGLRSLTDFQGVTGSIQFREGGEVQKFTRVYAIREGTPIDYQEHLQARRERLLEELRRLREGAREKKQT